MSLRYVVLFALVALSAVQPARAGTDQHCLEVCRAQSLSSQTCLEQCSYDLEVNKYQPPIGVAQTSIDPHRVLATPLPSEGLLQPAAPVKQTTKLDRGCFNLCLAKSFQYDLCNERCTRPACPPGKITCPPAPGAQFFYSLP